MAKKNIIIVDLQKKELEKTKTKLGKKGYKFLKFEENGTLKSVAVFQVEESILKKEKSMQLIVVGIGFLVVAVILQFK